MRRAVLISPAADGRAATLAAMIPALLDCYDRTRRHLPWREEPTPYRVWISEIMLQQTRVEAVKPYFARFIEALPDVYALAACPPDTLHKLWEGLGYYSRVRNLQRAAELIVRDYGGVLPSDPRVLMTLPGIGSYTAGAIAAFAYGVPAPAVDGNVLRVLARFFGDERNVLDPHVKRDFEAVVAAALPDARAGDVGQALIELGALVCLPASPTCSGCPLRGTCRARQDGTLDRIPCRAKAKTRRVETRTVLLLALGDMYLIHRRPDTGLLASLYEFPSLEGDPDESAIRAALSARGLSVSSVTPLVDHVHVFTHLEWHMRGFRAELVAPAIPAEVPFCLSTEAPPTPSKAGDYLLLTPQRIRAAYPLPSAFAPFLDAISS